MDSKEILKLEYTALKIRRNILRLIKAGGAGHVGGALSSVEILTALYFNLLNIDDESLLIGKSKEGVIGVFGFNSYSVDIFNCLVKSDFNYNAFLSCIKTFNHFIHTLNDILLIKNIEHFKQLYIELSQKKSMEYCSQQMHEKFTHLFIEYKELLK